MKIQAVPTNIITGFLGAGKSSAILHLLEQKPEHERWAVLVNEFGEIGIDGDLLSLSHQQSTGIFVKEVAGGCMCCSAGIPMQISLNLLLAQAKPHRLLIEPTGLGHPKEVLQVLQSEFYQDVLKIDKTITLVDARKLLDDRYVTHPTFMQQIEIADIVVGNKLDLYNESDQVNLASYVANINDNGGPSTQIIYTEYGGLSLATLSGESQLNNGACQSGENKEQGMLSTEFTSHADEHNHNHNHNHNGNPHPHGHHKADSSPSVNESSIPSSGYLRASNSGEGFYSTGWRFSESMIFEYQALATWLASLEVERVKGVLNTDKGSYSINGTIDTLHMIKISKLNEGRVEVIGSLPTEYLEKSLLRCILSS